MSNILNNTSSLQAVLEALQTKAAGGGSGEAAEWSENENAMVTGTLSTYTNSQVSSIRQYAFAFISSLQSVSFPNVLNIGKYAFYSCAKLTTASFPAATTIGNNAFTYCKSLTTASFPAAVIIGSNAFGSCAKLTTVSFPAVTSIGNNAFNYCANLTTVSFPAATTIGSNVFNYCSNLTTVSFPAATTIGSNVFKDCHKLTTVSFPLVTFIESYAFAYCSKLTTATFPVATTIGSNAFSYCYLLSSLYLINSSICTLSNSNAFKGTPYTGFSTYFSGTPYIYVPASLVSAYQTATNWAYFSSRFVAYDGGTNIITFTIDGIEYQAEEGMTWGEWIDSEYNTNNWFFIGSDNVLRYNNNQGYCEVYYNNILVLSNNEIIQDAVYRIVSPGTGD